MLSDFPEMAMKLVLNTFHISFYFFKVVFCGRNEQAGASIAAENNATFIKCDVTVPEQVESFFKQVDTITR